MVRFRVNYGAHIAKNLAYLDYDRLKVIIHEQEGETKSLLRHRGEREHPKFSVVFFQELERVDRCYVQHMVELDYTLADMQKLAKDYTTNKKTREKWQRKAQEAALKRSATHLHNKITKLETFRLLNRTAAIKILKKHDKLAKETGEESFLDSHMARVGQTAFGDGTSLSVMKEQLEEQYADVFCHGVLEEARGKLRLAKTNAQPEVLLSVAFKVGIILTLLAWLAYNFAVAPKLSLLYLTDSDPSVYIYAAVGALITYRWFWGFSVYMWDSVDIDYIFILDLDAIKVMPTNESIFSETGTLTILYLLNVIIFHAMRYQYAHKDQNASPSMSSAAGFISALSAHAYILPFTLVVGFIWRVSLSVTEHKSSGVFSSKVFKTLLRVPFSTVHLRFTYAADILTSLNRVFVDVLYGGCYFFTGSFLYAAQPDSERGAELFESCQLHPFIFCLKVFIQLFPYYIRLMQCLRQRRDHFLRHDPPPPPAMLPPSTPEAAQESESSADTASSPARPSFLAGLSSHGRQDYVSALQAEHEERGTTDESTMYDHAATYDPWARDLYSDFEEDTADATQYLDHDLSPLAEPIRRSPSKPRLRASTLNNEENASSMHGHGHSVAPYTAGGSLPSSGPNSPVMNPSGRMNHTAPRNHRLRRWIGLSRSESFDYRMPSLIRSACDLLPTSVSTVFRTVMVWPYSYNALRYFLSMLVIFFGAFPPSDTDGVLYRSWYLPLYVISTLFSCYWDVAMDFQLMQFNCKKPLLRSRLFYEETEIFYYIVLVLNPILRFMWTLNFTPFGGQQFLVVFEIARRSMWACLRMELGYIQELERRK